MLLIVKGMLFTYILRYKSLITNFSKKIFDKKKPNQSKADVARKFDNELKKIDEIWAKTKDTKMNY